MPNGMRLVTVSCFRVCVGKKTRSKKSRSAHRHCSSIAVQKKVLFFVAVVIARPGHRTEVGLSGTGSSGQYVNLVEVILSFFSSQLVYLSCATLRRVFLETRVWRRNRTHRHRLLSRLQHLKPWAD